MIPNRPILEDDLHAFVDQRLDGGRRSEVQTYLDAHPDVAAQVAAFQRQRDALRAAAAPIADEPIPPRLNVRNLIEARRRPREWSLPWRSVAAALLFLAAGGAGGWSLRSQAPDDLARNNSLAALAHEAAYTFDVFGTDRAHSVEVGAADQAELVRWIASRTGRTVAIPDLMSAGYSFMGGRVVATPQGAAGLLMYTNDQGQRLAVMERPMAVEQDSRMSEHDYGDIRGFAWTNKGTGFSLVGEASPDLLLPIANTVRAQEGSVI
jgi:anti-sigma factor RsiW